VLQNPNSGKVTLGVLDGGLARIGIAAHLEHDCEVSEKEGCGGAPCQTAAEQGLTDDAGCPHIIFSRNQQMVVYMVLLLGDDDPRACGCYVKYPFENGLTDLDPQDRRTRNLAAKLNREAPAGTQRAEVAV